ncbi:acetoacetyl-CoA reductase [Solemya velum gill symbiont]|uniref:Beta-ketoacyl-ACP reductase n=1 Tax=Solemya velum gill symbiont TaxID=2340 RepID=A0A1T2E5K7_SOVGS|nr:acetoacetyl-CoA reductase [Solemya velum gill symbiont]OOY35335.1 beta-ketoacyl-ACP reductase [Solemya velum gill symbiont]OOY38074.1 beta-ketoacyl-ACP reductase [Solemya velum gill symbiont]OOY41061.1 beta-ketoacyl-ACP reductase [Solemya velum gill symbiont]OOY48052.1 beta-ketoacyl-ACP reductase [Solemya velum gill symbiont]OOY48174.1 beta-ketoacyl-ACP reductase [Solemya velum gill symbiont]
MSDTKIALVTGGTGGIGTTLCRALTDQGRKVVANYFPPEKEKAEAWQAEQKEAGYDIGIAGADVTDYDAVGEMIKSIEEEFGPVSILVNCAGITRDKTLKGMTPDMWNAVINTNLNSAYNVTRQVFLGMTERGFGRIVNISSINGQKGQFGQANYSAAKAGLHGFTMAVAQEGARKNVTVNTVSPGYVETDMTALIAQEVLDSIIKQIPMGRMAQPEEIALAVTFCTDDANSFMTGANLPVNGGMFIH